MGIYIPGINMPDSCDNCLICNRCEGNCDISDADYLPNKRPDDCPLIELPPHGRLIDADALWEKEKSERALKKYRPKGQSIIFDAGFLAGFRAAAQIASKMPTIIPASGGNENE